MNEINLLPKETSSSFSQDRLASLFRRIAMVALVATAVVTVVIFILVFQSPLSKAKQQEQQLLSDIGKYSVRISRNSIIQERMTAISQTLETRNVFEKQLLVISDALPADVTILSLDITKGKIVMSAKTPTLESAHLFFDTVQALKEKKQLVQAATLKTYAQQTTEGKYIFTIELLTL